VWKKIKPPEVKTVSHKYLARLDNIDGYQLLDLATIDNESEYQCRLAGWPRVEVTDIIFSRLSVSPTYQDKWMRLDVVVWLENDKFSSVEAAIIPT
jgi:hypothetical protein